MDLAKRPTGTCRLRILMRVARSSKTEAKTYARRSSLVLQGLLQYPTHKGWVFASHPLISLVRGCSEHSDNVCTHHSGSNCADAILYTPRSVQSNTSFSPMKCGHEVVLTRFQYSPQSIFSTGLGGLRFNAGQYRFSR
jgi:hypothetical protein